MPGLHSASSSLLLWCSLLSAYTSPNLYTTSPHYSHSTDLRVPELLGFQARISSDVCHPTLCIHYEIEATTATILQRVSGLQGYNPFE